MARILVFCKYLPSATRRSIPLTATSYRSEQLVRPLIAAGHQLTVFTSGMFTRGERFFEKREIGSVDYYETCYSHCDQRSQIAERLRGRTFDAVIAVSQISSNYALEFCGDLPLWCDLYGSVMGEAQAKCYRDRTNQYLDHFRSMELPVIERADKLSTCGRWQEHMLCGELAMIGRLNMENFGYQLVHGILPGVIDPEALGLVVPRPDLLRGSLFARDAHVVLWMGGYNTWTDVDTLFAGLEAAMQTDPRLAFVSIGGAIPGHDESTYARFQQMVERSAHVDRYLLKGWVDRGEISKYLVAADLGLNIDSWHYETVFGTRTRLVEMLGYGLPVVTSRGCELSEILETAGTGLLYDIGDPEGLAVALSQYFQQSVKQRRRFALRSQTWAQSELSFEKTTASLQQWAESPVTARDRSRQRLEVPKLRGRSNRVDPPHPLPLRAKFWNSLRRDGLTTTLRRSYEYLKPQRSRAADA